MKCLTQIHGPPASASQGLELQACSPRQANADIGAPSTNTEQYDILVRASLVFSSFINMISWVGVSNLFATIYLDSYVCGVFVELLYWSEAEFNHKVKPGLRWRDFRGAQMFSHTQLKAVLLCSFQCHGN